MSKLESYSKDQLLSIIKCYDQYIQSFYENETGSYPVCLLEFIDNEYSQMLEDGYTDYIEWANLGA